MYLKAVVRIHNSGTVWRLVPEVVLDKPLMKWSCEDVHRDVIVRGCM